jgi:hypothetical protein
MIRMTHSGIWDEVIRTIRDPIFGLVFAVFLAFLGSRPIRRLIRFACLLAAVIILIWLAAHNTSSAHVEIAVVAAVTRILLTLIAVLLVVALIAIVALFIMYFKAAPASSSLSSRRSAWRTRPSFIDHGYLSAATSGRPGSSAGDAADGDIATQTLSEEGIHLSGSLERVELLVGGLFDNLDYCNNPAQVCVELMRIYFSGLSAHSAEIREAHEECNKSIERMASALGRALYDVRLPLRDMSQKNWFPSSSEWAAVAQGADFNLPYLALRLICLKAVWRAAAMVIYKSYACSMILAQLDDL